MSREQVRIRFWDWACRFSARHRPSLYPFAARRWTESVGLSLWVDRQAERERLGLPRE